MRERKIINYTDADGGRTSASLSEFQLDVLDRLAREEGISKGKYLKNCSHLCHGCVNMSGSIRDIMFARLISKIDELQEQTYEANQVIGELYHLCDDKKKASSVVCDYLVKYGEPMEVK